MADVNRNYSLVAVVMFPGLPSFTMCRNGTVGRPGNVRFFDRICMSSLFWTRVHKNGRLKEERVTK